jgi:hypothetical protein
MEMIVPTGLGMILTSLMLTIFGWATQCETCLAAHDGSHGSFLLVAGLGLVTGGAWARRRNMRDNL